MSTVIDNTFGIKIDPELQSFLPRLTDEEYAQLEKNLLAEPSETLTRFLVLSTFLTHLTLWPRSLFGLVTELSVGKSGTWLTCAARVSASN
jgi:hypothetical protein